MKFFEKQIKDLADKISDTTVFFRNLKTIEDTITSIQEIEKINNKKYLTEIRDVISFMMEIETNKNKINLEEYKAYLSNYLFIRFDWTINGESYIDISKLMSKKIDLVQEDLKFFSLLNVKSEIILLFEKFEIWLNK